MNQRQVWKALGRIPRWYVGAGVFSAALLVLSFPYYSAWGLAFIGMVPLLVAMCLATSYRQVAWAAFACMVFFILFGYQWIAFVATNFGGLPWIVGKLVLIVFSLFTEAQFLAFGLTGFVMMGRMAAWINKRSKKSAPDAGALAVAYFIRAVFALVFMPLLYIGLDAVNPKIFPSSFGHVLYSWISVAQLAEFGGVYGLTLPIVVTNFAVTALVLRAFKKFAPRLKLGPASRAFPGVQASLIALACVGVFFWQADRWGRGRMAELENIERSFSREFKFSVIQGNIGDIDKLASERGFWPAIEKVTAIYDGMTRESVKRFHPDLVIWPETSWPFLFTHSQDEAANRSGMARDKWIKDFVGDIDTPLFFGAYSSFGKRDFNTAFLVTPDYRLGGLYRKSILLAFGEYIPLGPLAPYIQSIVPTIADFGRGQGPMVFDFKGIKLAPQICYEGIVPDHSRGGAQLGAHVLLNITNDSWFGEGTEPWLHLALTVFRAIELRRPMIRATNTGISTLVGITGEMRYKTHLFEPAQIEAAIRVPASGQAMPETFYMKHGEVFARMCTMLAWAVLTWLVAPFLWSTVKKRRLKRKSGA